MFNSKSSIFPDKLTALFNSNKLEEIIAKKKKKKFYCQKKKSRDFQHEVSKTFQLISTEFFLANPYVFST